MTPRLPEVQKSSVCPGVGSRLPNAGSVRGVWGDFRSGGEDTCAGQPSRVSTDAHVGAPAPDSGPVVTLLAVVSGPPPPRIGAVTFELDLALVNASNLRDSHGWAMRARYARKQRAAVGGALRGQRPPPGPWIVALHRTGWNKLDSDGLVTASKHVRDALAHWLGEDDRSTRIRWVLSQEITRERRTVPRYVGGRVTGLRAEAAAKVRVEVATDEGPP
jgi:hypothetical protein